MPTYKLEAIQFRCIDESGVDWTGSDEPYFVWNVSTEQNPGNVRTIRSREFGDIDSGDTKSFSPPIVLADNVSGGLGLHLVVMEADAGNQDRVIARIGQGLKAARWAVKLWAGTSLPDVDKTVLKYLKEWFNDDALGQRTIMWAQWELAQGHPTVGSVTTEEVGYKGSAKYAVTYRVTRVS